MLPRVGILLECRGRGMRLTSLAAPCEWGRALLRTRFRGRSSSESSRTELLRSLKERLFSATLCGVGSKGEIGFDGTTSDLDDFGVPLRPCEHFV